MGVRLRLLLQWPRSFLHPTGRHRLRTDPPSTPYEPPPLTPRLAATVRAWYTLIDGTSTRLVRPYLVAHELLSDTTHGDVHDAARAA
ncbi:hypothetical protein [Streptomyces sp. NPDC016845]|uniref:hypothetical protein n=1 Tax=Streptomyces sp. NPDC016845 TaxID=3364972 RepID=UPI00379CACC8